MRTFEKMFLNPIHLMLRQSLKQVEDMLDDESASNVWLHTTCWH